MLKLAKQIVELGKGFSRFYEKEATDAVRKENFNHAHFITTIEEVINILTPSSLATVDESSKAPGLDRKNTCMRTSLQPNEKNDNSLSNRFNHLEVEEPVDIDEASPTSATTASTANAIDFKASNGKRKAGREVKYQPDEDEEDDEKFFAMHCLFTDLHDLRTFIGKTWEDYSCGRLDLMTSPILANTAFDLARRADENYFAMCPEAGSAQNLIETFMDFLGLLCGVDPFHNHQPDDWFNYRLADGAQWVCPSTSILLVSFRKLIEPKQMSLIRPGFFGDYDAKSDRHAMSLRQKFAERTILLEALPEFCLLRESKLQFPAEDEMTKALRQYCQTKQISIFLCFATQIYLETTHIRRDEIATSFHELQTMGERVKTAISTVLAQPRSAVWPNENDQILRNITSFVDLLIHGDAIDKMRRIFLKPIYGQGNTEKHYLLSRHPLLCGLLQFFLTIMIRTEASFMATSWASILYVGHHYNALRQTSNLVDVWPDMETFILINTPRRLFVGGLPTTLEDCLRRYSLMMGTAPEA